ncbi:hypothetical protein M9Y10_043411 [Tritrichomonas musculus]|uniref:HYDIN/VesB/CFA65-like Ig-like domain-containing protein n=1 Tax=Tritrichomonas musculus TaxID=1915356 RepID=A0ABR2JZN9_9EUKA
MSQDVSVNPMIAVIDVVQNAVDYSALTDYLKTNFKKEIVFLNAHDFTDAGGRVAKTDNKSSSKGKNTTGGLTSNNSVKNIVIDPQSQAIAKGIKAKIDADLVKVLESKRKTYASFEKEKLKALSKSAKNSSNEDKANSLKSRAVIDFDELKMSLPFEGKIDILYIIVNFPYLPRQLARIIECGVDLNVFLAIVPSNFDEKENHDSQRGDEGDNTQRDASVKSPIVVQGNKKSTIPGQEFDSLQNPNVFPPLRWISLKETAPAHVIFEKVYAGDNIESTFKNIEEKLILFTKARESYNDYFSEKTLIELPIISHNSNGNQTDNDYSFSMNSFIDFLSERQGDFINALYYELKSHDFQTIPPPPPVPLNDQFSTLFKDAMETLDRRVVFLEPREINSSDFAFDFPFSVHSLIYKLIGWTLKKEETGACQALSCFLNHPQNFYAYAGSKFDSIVQSTNKKHQLSLPLSFFDWSQWNYIAEYLQLGEALVEGIRNSEIIETSFDESVGILWILALQPVPKTIGQYQSRYSMPQTFDGITEYIDRLYNNGTSENGNTPQPEKKSRNPPSPAQVVRDNLDINILLPSLQQRMNDNNSYYRMPIKVSNSIDFNAPYYFDSGLKVNIRREVVNEKVTFNYTANFKQYFDVFANKNSVTVQTFEGIRIMFEKPFSVTILFNEQSIQYNSESIVIKSTGEFPIMITKNGTFIMNDKDGIKTIVHPNGTITRNVEIEVVNEERTSELPSAKNDLKNSLKRNLSTSSTINENINKETKTMAWRSIDKEGCSFLQTSDGELVKEDLKHGEVVDFASMTRTIIRPDNIEYYIKKDGTRKIIFGLDFSIEQSSSNSIEDAIATQPKSLNEGNKLNKAHNMDEINDINNLDVNILDDLQSDEFIFDIPNFPVIQMKGNEMTMTLDRFIFNFCEKNVKMTCPDYSININTENVNISAPPPSEETEAVAISASLSLSISKMNNSNRISTSVSNASVEDLPTLSNPSDFITMMCLAQNKCEFRCNEKVLVADQKGLEKMYQLEEPNQSSDSATSNQQTTSKKKKVDLSIMTQWGKANPIKDTITEQQQVDFYKLFMPHFYAIRSDMTMCEFLRKDAINDEGCTVFEEVLSHPTGYECNIITYHHPIRPSAVYFINKPQTKSERSTILKGLHIPKPKKEKPKTAVQKPVTSTPSTGISNSALSNEDSEETSQPMNSKDQHKHHSTSRKSKPGSSKDIKVTDNSTDKKGKIKGSNSELLNDTESATDQRKSRSRSKSRAMSSPEAEERVINSQHSNRLEDNKIEDNDDDSNSEDDEALSLAEAHRNTLLCYNKLFVNAMNNWLDKHNIAYEEMMHPPEEPEPEILLVPPPTPSPRILEAQANKYSKTVAEFESGAATPNYWESLEAEFAMPLDEPRTIERDLSPRIQLHDPPRRYNKKKRSFYYYDEHVNTSDDDDNLDIYDEETYNNLKSNVMASNSNTGRSTTSEDVYSINSNNSTSNTNNNTKTTKKIIYNNKVINCSYTPGTNRNSLNTVITRPVTVKATPNAINFGKVKAMTSASAQLVITNVGKVPLHYSVTQTSEPNIRVLTIPGVVFPGLKMTLKVALLPIKYAQNISTSFQLKTQMFDLSIPVTADIVEE